MKPFSKYLRSGFLSILFVGCGGGGDGDHSLQYGGEWNVDVHFSANGCPSSVPVVEDLEYVHDVFTTPDQSVRDAVLMVDDQGDTFSSGETRPGTDSFIVTGQTHPLNPFINNFNCNETIVWSYFDIKEVGGRLVSNNVGRNSLIDCRSPSEEVHCNVYYSGSATQKAL